VSLGFQTSEDKSKGYNVLPFGKEVLEIEELRKQAPFSVLSNSDIGEQIEALLAHSAEFKPLLARLNPECAKDLCTTIGVFALLAKLDANYTKRDARADETGM
jgi:hypothetical protein